MVHVHDRNIQNIALLGLIVTSVNPISLLYLYLTLLHCTMVLLDSFIKRHITVTEDKGFFLLDG